jgi:ABC-type uncharacterized transport system
MSSSESTPVSDRSPGLLSLLARNRKQTGYALLVIAVLFALIPLWMAYHYKFAAGKSSEATAEGVEEIKPVPERELRYLPIMIWGGALALIFMGAAVWYLLSEETSPLSALDATRLMVLTIGGLSGLVTVLLIGLALPYFEWWNIFIGGVESWRKEWWRIGVTMLALFGGLALMFASLQLARADERSSAGLRRLLYGYNAVLTGLLVLAILIVLNVLTYVPLPAWGSFFSKPSDWTASNIFTLSTASKNLLASIDKPIKIYVFLAKRDPFYNEVENLMGNCRAANRRLEVEYVPPDSARAAEKMKQYGLNEIYGLLIIYGPEGSEEHEFVSRDELGSADRSSPHKFSFEGENALVTKLRLLTEGKSRATVYFAQGDGELDLSDSSNAAADRGLGALRERLEKANFQAKELRLDDLTLERIPDDAAVVVIARPSRPLASKALKALDAYMNPTAKDAKKGKLVVLLDVITDRAGNLVQTGLENFLQQFSVSVNNDRILILPNNLTRFPLQIIATVNPSNRSSLATAFANEPPYLFTGARSLEAKVSEPNNPFNRYSAEVLFQAPDRITILEPAPLHADPASYIEDLLKDIEKDENRRQQAQALLAKRPPAIAVTVTEPKEPDPTEDVHARMRGMKQEPRMVVFGDASWVANQGISRPASGYFELFVSVLNWLRERPEIGKMADPKERKFYTLSAGQDAVTRLEWLPGFLICLGIIGLGGGIWIVRRR